MKDLIIPSICGNSGSLRWDNYNANWKYDNNRQNSDITGVERIKSESITKSSEIWESNEKNIVVEVIKYVSINESWEVQKFHAKIVLES